MPTEEEIISSFTDIGVTHHDAIVIADCVITRKSCSWVNTDPVDDKMIKDIKDVVTRNNYRIIVNIQAVPTRSKYIWEIKIPK